MSFNKRTSVFFKHSSLLLLQGVNVQDVRGHRVLCSLHVPRSHQRLPVQSSPRGNPTPPSSTCSSRERCRVVRLDVTHTAPVFNLQSRLHSHPVTTKRGTKRFLCHHRTPDTRSAGSTSEPFGLDILVHKLITRRGTRKKQF